MKHPPRERARARLAKIWSSVLGIEAIGRDDDFFTLGGHSLAAVKVQTAIRHELGRHVEPIAVFRHRTVAAFARHLERLPKAEPVSISTNLHPSARTMAISLGQRGLWALHEQDPTSARLNLGVALSGTIPHPERLVPVVDSILALHPGLCSRFVRDADDLHVRLGPPPTTAVLERPTRMRPSSAARSTHSLASPSPTRTRRWCERSCCADATGAPWSWSATT